MSVEQSPTMMLGEAELILIPPGEFTMGSDKVRDNTKPSHRVYLDAFYIGKYPITNGQYKRFVEATSYQAPRHWSGSSIPTGKESHPVEYVTWHDARAYCQWLAHETGQVVRLPTEAEWEKAARGTDGREYPWGDQFDKGKCNTRESRIHNTTPVGRYSPQGDSPYGIADMAGNVWEWASSLHKPYPYDPDDGREDLEAEGARVLRGGSFDDTRAFARVTYRCDGDPASFSTSAGLRLVVLRPGSP